MFVSIFGVNRLILPIQEANTCLKAKHLFFVLITLGWDCGIMENNMHFLFIFQVDNQINNLVKEPSADKLWVPYL